MAVKKGLGKGLDSLIADKVGTSNEKTDAKNEVMVNINKVEPKKRFGFSDYRQGEYKTGSFKK